ncbi:coiled-coil domain-containing protein 191-like [Diadema setosum]|uniref:coiled-coil domain-containing protein 191-like n=1 Tax=Diadema setosum TaxID=31175 RepID=UPI003B3B889F
MAGSREDLYRWKRLTSQNKPNLVTKKANKPSNDIQDWIKKVEDASNQAAAVTFGLPVRGQRSNGYTSVEATLDAVHDHDEAYQEAQDLLSQWMADKCNLDDHVTFEDDYDNNEGTAHGLRSPGVKSELTSQWEDMLERNDPTLISTNKYTSSDALLADIESRDDYSTVQSILGSLMQKELVEPAQKKKLRATQEERKRPDPRTTMAARQQKVKENREKKERERKEQLEQRQARKAAEHQARLLVQQEQKEKALRAQREELMIREEMARIKKEIQEQRRQEQEARSREKAIEAEARRQEDERRRKEEEVARRIEDARRTQEQQRMAELKETRIREAQEARRLQILQTHFHAWYQLVQDQRVQMGKARALSDWRSLLRAWNAWRGFVRACRAEREAKQTELDIKLSYRRKLAADSHYRQGLLRKTFTAWQVFVQQENLEKEQSQQQSARRSKMAAFLEAAASGRLWTNREEGEMGLDGAAANHPVSAGRVMVAMPSDRSTDPASSRSAPPTRSSASQDKAEKGTRHQSSRKPKHAWQVTRKHINLTAEEIASIGDNMAPSMDEITSSEHPPPGERLPSQSKKPIQYTVNNFEHRYAAQQKLLSEQQQQLREQRRLIEELQLAHKQQGLQNQLQQIRDGENVQTIEELDGEHPLDAMFGRVQDSSRSEETRGDTTGRTDATSETMTTNRSRGSSRPAPPLLKGMEERAVQRAKMKAEREERRRQREQQQLAEMQAEEERKQAEEEAEKKAAIERRKEQKRLAKQREIEKQRRIELAQAQMVKAELHHQTSLLRHYGFNPWLKLLRTARQNMQVAIDHHSHKVLHACLMAWHQMTKEVIEHRNAIADVRYNEILLRRSFNSWKRFGHLQSIQLQKARRHYLHRLKSKALVAWRDWATEERLRAWEAEEKAEEHDTRRVMRTAFRAWRRFPRMLKEERRREIRRQEMRRKVASLIPDFGLT